MASTDSVMFSSTWQILQHYRESGIYDLEEREDMDEDFSPLATRGQPKRYPTSRYSPTRMTGHERNISAETVSTTYRNSDSYQASPASSRSSYDSFPSHPEIRRRRTRSGEPKAKDLTLTRSNGSTQLDHKDLPQTKYFTRRVTSEPEELSPTGPPPPPPPKNALRNSVQRHPYQSLQDLAREEVAKVTRDRSRSPAAARRSPPALKVAVPGKDRHLVPPPRLDSLAAGGNPNFPSPKHGLRRPIKPAAADKDSLSTATTPAPRQPATGKRLPGRPDEAPSGFPKRKDSLGASSVASNAHSNATFMVGMSVSDMMASGLRSPSIYADSPGPPSSSRPMQARGYAPKHQPSKSTPSSLYPAPLSVRGTPLSGTYPQDRTQYPRHKPSRSTGAMDVSIPPVSANLAGPFQQPEFSYHGSLNHEASRSSRASVFSPVSPIHKHQRNRSADHYMTGRRSSHGPERQDSGVSDLTPDSPSSKQASQFRSLPGGAAGRKLAGQSDLKPLVEEAGQDDSPPPPPPPPKTGLPANPRPNRAPKTEAPVKEQPKAVIAAPKSGALPPPRFPMHVGLATPVSAKDLAPPQKPFAAGQMPNTPNSARTLPAHERYETLQPPPINRYGNPSRPGTPDSMRQPQSASYDQSSRSAAAASASPITGAHLSCYNGHRSQTASSNTAGPARCMSCWIDMSRVWTCSSCNLRICSACRGRLGEARGDLGAVLRRVESERGRNMSGSNNSAIDDNYLSAQGVPAGRQRSATSGSGSSAASGSSRMSHTSGISSSSSVSSLPVGASALSHLSRGMTPPPGQHGTPIKNSTAPPARFSPPSMRGGDEGAYPSMRGPSNFDPHGQLPYPDPPFQQGRNNEQFRPRNGSSGSGGSDYNSRGRAGPPPMHSGMNMPSNMPMGMPDYMGPPRQNGPRFRGPSPGPPFMPPYGGRERGASPARGMGYGRAGPPPPPSEFAIPMGAGPRSNRYPQQRERRGRGPSRGNGWDGGDGGSDDDEGGRGFGDMSNNLYPDMGGGPYFAGKAGMAASGGMAMTRVR